MDVKFLIWTLGVNRTIKVTITNLDSGRGIIGENYNRCNTLNLNHKDQNTETQPKL